MPQTDKEKITSLSDEIVCLNLLLKNKDSMIAIQKQEKKQLEKLAEQQNKDLKKCSDIIKQQQKEIEKLKDWVLDTEEMLAEEQEVNSGGHDLSEQHEKYSSALPFLQRELQSHSERYRDRTVRKSYRETPYTRREPSAARGGSRC